MRTKLVLFSSLIILVLALSACGPSASSSTDHTLSVTGTGTIYVTPDVAYINIGVHTENPDISQAVAENNSKAQAVVNALTSNGVDAKDIQTSNFSIYSSQNYDKLTGLPNGYYFAVDNTVYVTVRDLSKLGDLLNTVVGVGANNINSIQFDVADKTAAMAEARTKAMADASSLAKELAQTANVPLGSIVSISYTETTSPYYGYGMGGGAGKSEGGATAPINPGQVQVTATVNVSYAIK